MLVHQSLTGQQPEPEKKRHRGVLMVLRQPPSRIKARLLDDIRWVDPPLQPPVQAKRDHAAQTLAVPTQELQSRWSPRTACSINRVDSLSSGTCAMTVIIHL